METKLKRDLILLTIVFIIVTLTSFYIHTNAKAIEAQSREFNNIKENEYYFNLTSETNEFAWRDNLAKILHGKKEVPVKYGRIDLVTHDSVIEVEFVHKWHEGLGQAMHYAYETRKQGVIALISTKKSDKSKIEYVKQLCEYNRIKIYVMRNYHE